MDDTCQHCGENLDGGDIYEYFFTRYMNHKKALEAAKGYGWSETNKIHFNKVFESVKIIIGTRKKLFFFK